MNKKYTFAALLMLLALLFQSFVAPQPASAAFCDAAQFVADVTIPDGTLKTANQAFTKTWRLKNVGTCTWSKSYTLVFDNGAQMSAQPSVNFPNSVAPGATVDLSVDMTAPNTFGTFIGYWKLKNASGTPFGIGFGANKDFWVQIRVTTSGGVGTNYDFAKNVAQATWSGGVGTWVENPRLEDGSTYNGSGIEMIPSNATDGYVQAQYPPITIHSGDHFQTIVDCEYQAASCYVTFRLDYQIGNGAVQNLWTFRERYEGLYARFDRDLSGLAGQDVKFILRVSASGSPVGDLAMWVGPRITNAGAAPATNTPTPTVSGTPPTPTNTPVFSNNGDRATFAGETIPDNTVFGPNVSFTKVWKIKNTGRTTWTTAYKLVYVDGDQLGAPSEVPLTSTIAPNTTFNLPGVGMVSPGTNGTYTGYWMLKNAAGQLFGIGPAADQRFWVKIIVRNGSNFTPTPTKTVSGTPPTATPTSAGATNTPTPNTGPDRATFAADVTIPDGTNFNPNTSFTKTWRLRNTGSSTWTNSFKLVFVRGAQLNGPNEVPLTANVAPGAFTNISVDLKAPANGGTYRGYWMLKNASGQLFGIGFTANQPFWVDIFVPGPTATPTPSLTSTPGPSSTPTFTPTVTKTPPPGTITITLTPTKTATAGTPTATATKTNTPGTSSCDKAGAVVDVTVPDDTIFSPSTAFTKTWRIQNVGSCTWTTAYQLIFDSGSQMGGPSAIFLPSSVAPNSTVNLSVTLMAPTTNGTYRGYWKLKNASGQLFGIDPNGTSPFWVQIRVQGGTPGPTSTPTQTSVPGTATLTPAPGTPTLTPVPTTSTPTSQDGSLYAVLYASSNDQLLVFPSPGTGTSTASLDYNINNITRTGAATTTNSGEWWEIRLPGGGTGWVYGYYLTEYVQPATFCADSKVTTLLTNLGTALKNSNGTALAGLISPRHGVNVHLVSGNNPVNYNQDSAPAVFTSNTIRNWGPAAASGQTVSGTFKDVILPKLLDVYNSSYVSGCNDTSKAGAVSQPWPSEYTNINFYSLYKPATGTNLDWRDLLVGVEYVNGQPYVIALINFEWAP